MEKRDYEQTRQELKKEGYSAEDIEKICSGITDYKAGKTHTLKEVHEHFFKKHEKEICLT